MKQLHFVTQDNCPYCERLKPMVDMATDMLKIHVEYIDVTNDWAHAEALNVKYTPTLIVMEPQFNNIMVCDSDQPVAEYCTDFKEIDRIEARDAIPLLHELKAKFL